MPGFNVHSRGCLRWLVLQLHPCFLWCMELPNVAVTLWITCSYVVPFYIPKEDLKKKLLEIIVIFWLVSKDFCILPQDIMTTYYFKDRQQYRTILKSRAILWFSHLLNRLCICFIVWVSVFLLKWWNGWYFSCSQNSANINWPVYIVMFGLKNIVFWVTVISSDSR